MKYLVIVNPVAGKKKQAETVPFVRRAFETRKVPCEIRFTEGPGHAAELAADGLGRGFTHVVSLGGDGTSSEIAGAVRGTDAVLGIIPAGSGNDFPKAAGIPLGLPAAVENVFSGEPRRADAAFMDGKFFINGFGAGMDGAVARSFGRLGLRRLGSFGYVVGAVIEAFRFGGFEMETDGEGRGEFSAAGKLLLFGASNGPFQGGKFNLAAGADIFDGYLDVHIIDDMNPAYRLARISRVLEGRHEGLSGISMVRTRRLGFRTFEELPAHMDGETFVLPRGTHGLEVAEKAVNVMVPAGVRERAEGASG